MIYILSYFLEHIFISKIILIFIIIKTKTSDAPLTTYSRVWKIESTKEIESETAHHKRNLNRNREAEHQVQQTDEPPSREGADPRRKGKGRGRGAVAWSATGAGGSEWQVHGTAWHENIVCYGTG